MDDTPADEASPASAAEVAATTTTAAASLSTPPTAALSVTGKPASRRKHHKKKASSPGCRHRCVAQKLTSVGSARKQPAGTASDLEGASIGDGNKHSGAKAQGYMEEIVVAKITEITSSQEEST